MSSARGRGRHYSPFRHAVEAVLGRLYTGGWPARAWGAVPGATTPRSVEITLPLLPPKTPPLRIAFASDLHLGPTTPPALLERAFARIAAWEPHVLALGGDYVFLEASAQKAARLAELAASVPAATKVAVLGNHDLWTRHERLERALEGVGVRVLVNDALRLPPPHADVALLGLDDPWTGAPDAVAALAACGDARVRLAVVHSPDGVPMLAGGDVALTMCGHTHGGQVALPGGRPIVVPGRMGRTWPWGLHRIEEGWLFVSRGLGGVEIPVRLWAPPDVGLITLEAG